MKLHGHRLSPYVRKVRLVLEYKGIAYEHDEISPMEVDDEYRKKNPLGKIPTLEAEGVFLPDSSVIAQYLEFTHPDPSVLPGTAMERAQALWFEEYLDTAMMGNIGGPFFFNRVIKPKFLKQESDEELLKTLMKTEIPKVLSYLDEVCSKNDFMAGKVPSIADLTLFSHFRSAHLGGFELPEGYSNLDRMLGRVKEISACQTIFQDEMKYLAENMK